LGLLNGVLITSHKMTENSEQYANLAHVLSLCFLVAEISFVDLIFISVFLECWGDGAGDTPTGLARDLTRDSPNDDNEQFSAANSVTASTGRHCGMSKTFDQSSVLGGTGGNLE